MASKQNPEFMTVDERWYFALTQVKNAAKLLGGELTQSTVSNSKGEQTLKLTIEYKDIHEKENAE